MPPTFPPFLHLLLLLLSAATAIAARPPSAAAFIRSSCSGTLYPALCQRTLSPFFPHPYLCSHRRAAFSSLLVTFRHAHAASSYASALAARYRGPAPVSLRDCADTLSDSAYQIWQSLHQMRHMGRPSSSRFAFSLSNVQTWASAALTDLTTCTDGLDEDLRVGGIVKAAVSARVAVVRRFTSNSLALINLIDGPTRPIA